MFRYIVNHSRDVWILSEKRSLAQKAEADFFTLLRESGIAQDSAVWKDVGDCLVSLIQLFSGYFTLRSSKPFLRIPAMMLLARHLCVRSYLTPS